MTALLALTAMLPFVVMFYRAGKANKAANVAILRAADERAVSERFSPQSQTHYVGFAAPGYGGDCGDGDGSMNRPFRSYDAMFRYFAAFPEQHWLRPVPDDVQ